MNKQEVILSIDSVGRRGDGVGQWQGRPVFVPRALPGERVRVRLLEDRDKGIAGQLLEILTPSGVRTAAPCPHYERCGGCSLQHWTDDDYRTWKIERIPLLLDRAGIAVGKWKEPVFIPDRTRRRATLAAVVENRKLRLGYHRARSHEIVDIDSCLVLSPRLQALADRLRPHLTALLTGNQPADIFLQDTGEAFDAVITGAVGARKEPGLAEREAMAAMVRECGLARLGWRARERDETEIIVQMLPVAKRIGPLTVDLPPNAFMQPSAEGEAALVAASLAPLRAANIKRSADLFAGSGTFAGPLLDLGSVYAADSEGGAIAALQKAAKGSPMTVERRNLFASPLTEKELKPFDAVLFDPPRMGAKEQAACLAASQVPLVVGISCNPATFVRDAGLLQGGGYRLESVQVIDQFVWSAHLELVGIFRKE